MLGAGYFIATSQPKVEIGQSPLVFDRRNNVRLSYFDSGRIHGSRPMKYSIIFGLKPAYCPSLKLFSFIGVFHDLETGDSARLNP